MNLNLAKKIAIVTGGASGIGEAIVRGFVAEGTQVVFADRNAERGHALAQKLGADQQNVRFVEAELQHESDCRTVLDVALSEFGRLDCLVNNAGVNDKVGLDAGVTAFCNSLFGNAVHYYALAHLARQALIESRGSIVNIASKVAVTGQGGTSGYAAAKGAILALTREWAIDFLPHRVRVNAILPAETWTPLYESWVNSFPEPQKKLRQITAKIPLGQRMTTAEEIADMVLFLASDRAAHITGQHLFVDGGYTHLDRTVTP